MRANGYCIIRALQFPQLAPETTAAPRWTLQQDCSPPLPIYTVGSAFERAVSEWEMDARDQNCCLSAMRTMILELRQGRMSNQP